MMVQKTIEAKVNKLREDKATRRSGKLSYCLYVNNMLPHAEATM